MRVESLCFIGVSIADEPVFFTLCSLFFMLTMCVPVEVTLALLDAANDKDAEVQEQVRKSVLTLGKQQPDRVLAICQDYLLKHPKVKPHITNGSFQI